MANGMIDAVNDMFAPTRPEHTAAPNASQVLAQQCLIKQASAYPRSPKHLVQQREAVDELLHSTHYVSTTVRSYDRGLVSLARPSQAIPAAVDVLDAYGREILEDPCQHMLVATGEYKFE